MNVMTVMTVMTVIQNMDNSILSMIKDNMHSHIMDKIMVVTTSLGNGSMIWIAIALL